VAQQRRGSRFALSLVATLVAAQTLSTASTATAASTTSTSAFIPGSAVATSQAFAFDPRNAGLAATITLGRSVAQYRNELAQASAQALDLGLIGSSLTVQCSSLPPTLTPEQLPKPIAAESNAGASESDTDLGGTTNPIGSAVGGRSHVQATPAPDEDSLGSFDGGFIDIPGVISVHGLSSSAHAHYYVGHARLAESTADVGSVDLGPVKLGGLHWQTSVRTGSKPASSSTFTVSTVSIGGTKLPTASTDALVSTLKAVNKALGPTGLHILMPQVSHADKQLAMTPLSIGIKHSALGKMLLVPILNAIHTIFDPVATTINKSFCTFGSVYGALNLMIAALDGIGQFDISLGGTTAATDDATYANPFGNGGDDTPPNLGGTTAPPPSGGDLGNPGKVDIPPLPDATGTVPPAPAPQVAGREVAASCSTTSPAGRPTCGRGAGLAVGLIALAALGGIAAADFFVVRRRRRLARMAIT
jgi:hypothetical protein